MASTPAVDPLAALSWKNGNTESSLDTLHKYVISKADEQIAWYWRGKRPMAAMSQWLRFVAIILTTIGGLVPIAVTSGVLANRFAQYGYLLLGLAGGCVLLDRFFGYSTTWIRFITAALRLEKLKAEFQMDWAILMAKLAGELPRQDQVGQLLQRVKDFSSAIDAQVDQETQAWVAEFQSSLAQLEKTARAQLEEARPGAIEVNVTNGAEAGDGFTVLVDGVVAGQGVGTEYQVMRVPPGPHSVSVKAIVSGAILSASDITNVQAGAVAKVVLKLAKV